MALIYRIGEAVFRLVEDLSYSRFLKRNAANRLLKVGCFCTLKSRAFSRPLKSHSLPGLVSRVSSGGRSKTIGVVYCELRSYDTSEE